MKPLAQSYYYLCLGLDNLRGRNEMSIKVLKDFLKSQCKKSVKEGDYQSCRFRVRRDDLGIHVSVDEIEVGFSFNKRGQFLGMYNWKQ